MPSRGIGKAVGDSNATTFADKERPLSRLPCCSRTFLDTHAPRGAPRGPALRIEFVDARRPDQAKNASGLDQLAMTNSTRGGTCFLQVHTSQPPSELLVAPIRPRGWLSCQSWNFRIRDGHFGDALSEIAYKSKFARPVLLRT